MKNKYTKTDLNGEFTDIEEISPTMIRARNKTKKDKLYYYFNLSDGFWKLVMTSQNKITPQ